MADDRQTPFDAQWLIELGRVTELTPSPDGSWAAVAVSRLDEKKSAYVSDLWRVPLRGDGRPTRLTWGDHHDRAPRFRRDGALAFLSNRKVDAEDEGKAAQIWLFPPGGGEPVPLTEEPLGVLDFKLASGGDRLVVIAPVAPGVPFEEQRSFARRREHSGPSMMRFRRFPVRHWDSWVEPFAPHVIAYDEQGRKRRDLTPEADREHRNPEWDLAPDGSVVAVTHEVPSTADRFYDRHLRIIDTVTAEGRDAGKEAGTQLMSPCFSPDGARLACAREERSMEHGPRVRLFVLEVNSGQGRVVAKDWDRWPTPHGWTTGGASVLATADDAGQTPVFRVTVASGEVTRLTAEELGGAHGGLVTVPRDNAVVGVRSSLEHPPEPFRLELAPGATPQRLTRLSGFTPEEGARWIHHESHTLPAEDGATIQYHVVKPASADGPLPALLWIHGGPMSQYTDAWHWRWNAFVAASAGYAVVLCNPRGSTGFGQGYIDAIWGNRWGEACYDDLMDIADAVAERADVDGERMAAMGASFGGYMINWIGAHTDRFKCLVAHASIFDMSAFYGVTDHPAWFGLSLGTTPHEDPEGFDRYSPHRQVRHWKTPTLVVHGERDYRVPVGEALALFEALHFHGVEAELVVFPDEGHWVRKPQNARAWYETILEYADRYLKR